MKLSEIIHFEDYLSCELPEDTEVIELTTDFNKINKNSLLIITNSKKLPQNLTYIEPPLAVLCDKDAILPENFKKIWVENPRRVMAFAYSRFYGINFNSMKFIGVTGTNGKTSTATFIKKVLTDAKHKVGFIGTGKIEIDDKIISDQNYSMTTPDPALLYKSIKRMEVEGCDTVVMEISSHALALDKVAPIKFEYAVFTNLAEEHLDFHENMENYYLAKKKLFQNCNNAIINTDDKYGRRLAKEIEITTNTVGVLWRADSYVTNIENNGLEGINYIYHGANFIFRLKLKMSGIYNVYNTMLAIAVCIDMGCRPCEVKKSLSAIDVVDGRYEIIRDEITVIIDYAHTTSAYTNILKELYSVKGKGQLVCVFGCGGERDKSKRPKIAEAAETYADKIIITTDNSRNENPKDIISDIIKGFKSKCYEINEHRQEAIRSAIVSAKKGDIVAIIGKGNEKYNIDRTGYHPFDEKEIVKQSLKERQKDICE